MSIDINTLSHQFKIGLGALVKDKFTGFEGYVLQRAQYLTGCDRYMVKPKNLDSNGLPQPAVWENENYLEVTDTSKCVGNNGPTAFKFNLGDVCTDHVTKFEGVVVCRMEPLSSILSYSLALREPKSMKDDREWLTFDENLLYVSTKHGSWSSNIRKRISEAVSSIPGGPCVNPPPRNF